MTVALVQNYRSILSRAWSVRLMALATVLSGAEAALAMLTPEILGIPQGVFAALAGVVSMAALVARVVAQQGLSDAGE